MSQQQRCVVEALEDRRLFSATAEFFAAAAGEEAVVVPAVRSGLLQELGTPRTVASPVGFDPYSPKVQKLVGKWSADIEVKYGDQTLDSTFKFKITEVDINHITTKINVAGWTYRGRLEGTINSKREFTYKFGDDQFLMKVKGQFNKKITTITGRVTFGYRDDLNKVDFKLKKVS